MPEGKSLFREVLPKQGNGRAACAPCPSPRSAPSAGPPPPHLLPRGRWGSHRRPAGANLGYLPPTTAARGEGALAARTPTSRRAAPGALSPVLPTLARVSEYGCACPHSYQTFLSGVHGPPPPHGQLSVEDVATMVLCKPKLLPLKSVTLEKLEKMQRAAQETIRQQEAAQREQQQQSQQ
ncbi:BBSome-interacting protein 1 [Platysternon megacephalum]|uniref:BBSome-interacting protein 1 n=1 Tax=Platysternon megacephalum TaxID=55544 RepID=A0A4D9EH71_9SAUR|nr:BBSome-interacting protein 1 [Platysternon megacephalum]